MWVSLEVQTWSSDCVQMATVAASVLTDNWQQTSLCTVVYQHLFALCNVWVTTTSYCNVSPEQWCTMRRYIIIVVSCLRHVLSPWCCHTQFRQLNTHFVKCHIQAVSYLHLPRESNRAAVCMAPHSVVVHGGGLQKTVRTTNNCPLHLPYRSIPSNILFPTCFYIFIICQLGLILFYQ